MKNNYSSIKNSEDLQFLLDIKSTLDVNSQCEVFLRYNNIFIMLEPHGEKISVYINGEFIDTYLSFDDMVVNFLVEGKPFIEKISEIDYE